MYYIGLLVFVILISVIFSFSATINNVIDFPSIIVVLGLSLPIVMASGLFSDFINGFKMMSQKVNTFSKIEAKRILASVQLMMKALVLSGFVGTLSGVVAISAQMKTSPLDVESLFISLGIAMIALLYALVFMFFLLPIEAKAKAVIASLE